MEKKTTKKKVLIAISALLLLLIAGGIYVLYGLHNKPAVYKQALNDKVQEELDNLLNNEDHPFYLYGGIYNNLRTPDGSLFSEGDIFDPNHTVCLYQKKANEMAQNVECEVGDITFQDDERDLGPMSYADVTFILRWYDMDLFGSGIDADAINMFIPYSMVGADTKAIFPALDRYLASAMEKAEAGGLTKEYEVTATYYLSIAGSNPVTGKGSQWFKKSDSGILLSQLFAERLLNEIDAKTQATDNLPEDKLAEREQIIGNMNTAIEMLGMDGARQLLEEEGYEGIVKCLEGTVTAESLPGVYVLVEREGDLYFDQTFLDATKLSELPGIKIMVIENGEPDTTAHFYYYNEENHVIYTGFTDGSIKVSTPYNVVTEVRGNRIVLDGSEWKVEGGRIVKEGKDYREVYERNDDIDLSEATWEMYYVGN